MSFCKVVVIGDSSTGKTSLINQFVNRRFAQDFKPTVGTDFSSKPISIGEEVVMCQLWDTAGQERFRSLAKMHYRGSEVVIVVFDITSSETFENVEEWVSEFKSTCNVDEQERFPVFIVGNKTDLEDERMVQRQDASRYCQAKGWQYRETSAKLADGIDALFRESVTAAVARRKQKNYLDEATTTNSSGGAGGGVVGGNR